MANGFRVGIGVVEVKAVGIFGVEVGEHRKGGDEGGRQGERVRIFRVCPFWMCRVIAQAGWRC